MAKTFNAGDVLTAADLNSNMVQPAASGQPTRIMTGRTPYSLVSQVSDVFTVNYGFTFGAIKAFIPVVESSSAFRLAVNLQGPAGNSSASIMVFEADNTAVTRSGSVNWIAVGTP